MKGDPVEIKFLVMSRSWLGVAGLALSASAMSSSSRKRRNSGGGAPGSKAMKTEAITDLKVPVDALLKSHVKLFDQWLMLGYCQCNNDIATCHECESHVFDSLAQLHPGTQSQSSTSLSTTTSH